MSDIKGAPPPKEKKSRKGIGGRPAKYKPEYCQRLIDHMAKGFPFETFAPLIGVSVASTYRWLNNKDKSYDEFREAKKHGEGLCYLHYMRMGQGLAMGKIKGNVTAWIFMMKNICHWRDHNSTKIGIGVGGDGVKVDLGVDAAGDTPTFEVEMSEGGKFKRLRPRRVN